MAKRVKLSVLRDLVRDRGEWRSAYISDSELNSWTNEACYKFYAMMSALDPLRYVKRSDVAVTKGTRDYSLPNDFFKKNGSNRRQTNRLFTGPGAVGRAGAGTLQIGAYTGLV